MTPKEFLKQYRDAEKEIHSKLNEIERLRALAERTTQVLRKDKVKSSITNLREEAMAALADMETEAEEAIYHLSEVKNRVQFVISSVPDSTHRTILTSRYINAQSWELIAVDLGYTYRHVTRLHGEALQSVKDVLLCPKKM